MDKRIFNNLNKQWFWGKLTYSIVWVFSIYQILLIDNHIISPEGIFQYLQLDFLFSFYGKIFLTLISGLAVILYISEQKMLLATGLLSISSILLISYQDSNGIFHRNTHFAAIFTSQYIAYLAAKYFSKFRLAENRLLYTYQIIAAIYFLAAISKIEDSGFNWFINPDNFTLQIFKNHFFLFADDGNIQHILFSEKIILLFDKFPLLPKFLLGISLGLEFFCFLILINNRLKYTIALGLISMHIGIAYFMGISISSIAFAVFSWIINPFYLFYILKIKYHHFMVRKI